MIHPTNITIKRFNIIHDMMKRHGIEYDGRFIISMWDLMFCINNFWKAEYFVIKKAEINSVKDDFGFALRSFEIYRIRRAVLHTIKQYHDIELHKSKSNDTEFLIIGI